MGVTLQSIFHPLTTWTPSGKIVLAGRRTKTPHKARSMPHQQFKEEVEKYLTGASEASELIYFKMYKSQMPVIEQALETAARMLGSDRSRGYCLEMICADFLAGANLENGNPDVLFECVQRLLHFLPAPQQRRFFEEMRRSA
jgi:hypothetical protein